MAAVIQKKRTIVESIPFHTLMPDSHLDFSLYYKGRDDKFKKIFQGGTLFGKDLKRKLASVKIDQLFVNIKEKDTYFSYLDKTLNEISDLGGRNKTYIESVMRETERFKLA